MMKLNGYQDKIDFICNKHDIDCNQKYNGYLPYSFHLKSVDSFGRKFEQLIPSYARLSEIELRQNMSISRYGHDLLEDCHGITYNDCVELFGVFVADIIYACTELRGHNRAERHGPEYFELLKSNPYALHTKLSDIMANATFGIATNSGMVKKYKKEFVHLKSELYIPAYAEMFDFLENVYKLV